MPFGVQRFPILLRRAVRRPGYIVAAGITVGFRAPYGIMAEEVDIHADTGR